ncbi:MULTISPECIES: Lrp/AsnC family transcriptional regulator [Streptomyces]|uniref:ArsR family transcriptional regulator n=1 Tax=Streptomyces venezuelae TaxID=54571 RepID=A0A5P2B585_STRVZ|nr:MULTISPECIES: Lrp/AsnC family transcriptional regulator [Streptomyces]NEA01570.1 Lrp/AsnC family transcriptional regulator [Streptomyces sp. SID10116]MYY84322.1 winged helix-turn-helix transcriptional regulator [Streptomyces sp. SID335]MYZ17783.1 winged helix-turn-helix transcriptional regulator [Streptomyces sp. SID337]NDZ90446.1 Lrp/AsnC family transcriptional regulator [Streptomyces sp. SID10115]NEB47518.1 Lrp/AsnC family transcriptional regulator [Streptomyces sp. SID339]
MDDIDRNILRELQNDGRLTNQELAARVGLSASPCMRRVRQLELDGVIQGYRAVVAPEAVGRGFEVLVSIEVRRDRETVEAFEAALQDIPDVIEAHRLFGSPGCLLRIAVADLAAYERLWIERLTTLAGVTEVNSQIIMKRIKEPQGLPVDG